MPQRNHLKALMLSFTLFFATLMTGCSTQIQRETSQFLGEKHRFAKNYKLGDQQTVSVGDQMIAVKDYYVDEFTSQFFTPSKSTTLSGGLVTTSLVAGKQYPLRGHMTIEGVAYAVVDSENGPAVLIKPNGTLHNRVANELDRSRGNYVLVIYTMDISDPSVIMTSNPIQKINVKKGYENFEIIYSGKNANSLNLTYREYTQDNMARPAFSQQLTYESNAGSIAFKKFRIAIHRATSNDITFTVIEDGYKQ